MDVILQIQILAADSYMNDAAELMPAMKPGHR